jgi:hypothetical protein
MAENSTFNTMKDPLYTLAEYLLRLSARMKFR